MALQQDRKTDPSRKQLLLAEKRAEALRANLKKRKEQTAARGIDAQNEILKETQDQ